MTGYQIAKAVHVLGVVLWIGGVAFVTFILIPAIRRLDSGRNPYELFERIEYRFARQARFTTLATGISGFYMVWAWDLWPRFHTLEFWWMHAMVLVWVLFTLMLFVLEPLVLHKWFREQAKTNPAGLMQTVQRLHWVLITVSLITVTGAVLGSH
ncbi:MAG: hypothetical protein ACE5FN_04360 [Leptospirillia bacterium]